MPRIWPSVFCIYTYFINPSVGSGWLLFVMLHSGSEWLNMAGLWLVVVGSGWSWLLVVVSG